MANFVDPILIVNKLIFESIQDIAVCAICTGLVIEAKQCAKCENCFCKKCIESWCTKSNSCPFKCLEFTQRDPSRVIKKILSRLVIQCPKNCNRQIPYDEIITHISECNNTIIDCPTCGSKVSETCMKRESYMDLQLENKILKIRIQDLESQLQNTNIKENNFLQIEENLLNVENNNHKKNNKRIPIKRNNKISGFTYEIHSGFSKSTFKFGCCNKDYDCSECHNLNEIHTASKPIAINCVECLHTSYNINDIVCYYCGVSFTKEKDENVKLDVIKYKNFHKKNYKLNNEDLPKKMKFIEKKK